MLIKINRKEAIEKFPNFPLRHFDPKEEEDVFNYPRVFANYVFTLPSKSYKGHIKLLGTQLVFLANSLGIDHFIFMGDEDTAWLRRFNTYDCFQESLQYLSDNKIGKRFNGALQVETAEIPLFIKHLAWLVRTNGLLPYVHFIDPEQNIIGNICQHGSLHISSKNKTADKKFKNIITKSQFAYLTDGRCYNKFSKAGAIKGRTLIV
ncbi:MAG: hypothetical protein RLY16_1659 [Bacteroidota bacterium]|jgi:hypothetical protein